MAKKIVSYQGKNYEVSGKTNFRERVYLKLVGLDTKVSEKLTGEKIEGIEPEKAITSAE